MRIDILERKRENLQWIAEEQPKYHMCQQLGCKQETLNSYLKKMGINYIGQPAKRGSIKVVMLIAQRAFILTINIQLLLLN